MKKTFIILLVIVLLAGCVEKDIEIDSSNYDLYLNQTLSSLVDKIELKSGGYSLAPIEFQNGDVFSTYFNIKTQNIINLDSAVFKDTSMLIHRYFQENQSNSPTLLYDLLYITELISLVDDINIKDYKEKIIGYVEQLKKIMESLYIIMGMTSSPDTRKII